jgi:RHS repeat-associated protein
VVSGNSIYYYVQDHLGTSRMMITSTGTACYDADFTPFGGEMVVTNTCTQNYKFTGKERDPETGLDNFGARYNSSNFGRFLSPDPKILNMRLLVNPQRWNKYAYTINNPLRYFDPNGMEEIEVQLRAFIPQRSVTVMGTTNGGDDRTFSTAANASSRTSITVRIETDASIRANPIISVTSVAGQSTKLDANGNVIKTTTSTSGLPTVNGTRDANGNVVLSFQQDTKNPLSSGPQALTRGISADLNVTISQNGSLVTAAGTTSGFPGIELNVTPVGQPTSNIPLNDPGPNGSPLSLLSTNTVLVSQPLPPPPPPCAQDKDKPCH